MSVDLCHSTQNLTSGVNGPLSAFIVRVCPDSTHKSSTSSVMCAQVTQTPSNLEVSVDTLHPWYFYHVQVAAVNDAGVGPFHRGVLVRMLPDGRIDAAAAMCSFIILDLCLLQWSTNARCGRKGILIWMAEPFSSKVTRENSPKVPQRPRDLNAL